MTCCGSVLISLTGFRNKVRTIHVYTGLTIDVSMLIGVAIFWSVLISSTLYRDKAWAVHIVTGMARNEAVLVFCTYLWSVLIFSTSSYYSSNSFSDFNF